MSRCQSRHIRQRIFQARHQLGRRACHAVTAIHVEEFLESFLVRRSFEGAEEMWQVGVEGTVGRVGGSEGVEVDFSLGAGLNYNGAGGVGGYTFAAERSAR